MAKQAKNKKRVGADRKSKIALRIEEMGSFVRKVLGQETKNKNIILFVGNGISGDGPLSTKKIVENFVKSSASLRPRDFDKERDSAKRLVNTFESGGEPVDMTTFMSDYSSIEDTKQEFVSYVIEECCRSRPNFNHSLLLVICQQLCDLNQTKKKIAIFTTNYDNLLERAFIQDRRIRSFFHPFEIGRRNFSVARMRKRSLSQFHLDKPVELKVKPKYALEIISDKRFLSIIPIHGSIRVCRCQSCNRILNSEIASLGKMRCVYCGEELPRVVVPTSEGEADKEVLKLFENAIVRAVAIVFVGYGFDDPHILDRIKRGISQNNDKNNLKIFNICNKVFPSTKISKPSEVVVFNIEEDIAESLMELSSLLEKKKKVKKRNEK